jgi:hypothetical protein
MKTMSSNISSVELGASFSEGQLRSFCGNPRTAYAHAMALNSTTVTLWLLVAAAAMISLEKSRWAMGNAYPLALVLSMGGLGLLNSARLWRKGTAAPAFGACTRLTFTILLFWCAVTIVRFDWFSIWEIKQALGKSNFAWAWIMPVGMVLGSDVGIWKRALRVTVTAGVMGCILLVVGWTLLSLRGDFGLTRVCPLALVFWHYLSKRTKRIVLLGSLITLLLSLLAATRNEVFGAGLLFLFASYIQFFRREVWRLRTRVYVMIGYSIALIMIFWVASVEHVPLVGDTINAGIDRFKGKLFDNTRAGEEGDSLYAMFRRDLTGLDFVVGRGCVGRYKVKHAPSDRSSGGYQDESRERRYIECGYLQIILHGGIVMLALILALAVPAIYLGMFRTRNWFTRGCAFIVLGRLLEMIPFGLPAANMRYVLFWMAIGACLSWRIRAMSETEILGSFAPAYAFDKRNRR